MSTSTEAEEIFKGLAEGVIAYDEEKCIKMANVALKKNIDPTDAILNGLARGMEEVGKLYEEQEYFIPEMLACADALNAAIQILRPHIRVKSEGPPIKVVIGTIEGDVHEIGKNLVKIMYEAAGWEVHDLGANVTTERFLEEQRKTNADVIAISALMTTSMMLIQDAVKLIKAQDPGITVVVGGAPLTRETAEKYGADGYSDTCGSAAKETKEAMKRVKGSA
jgi:methanogenic corrinoid protein MtbC1